MIIRDRDDFIELLVNDRIPDNLPTPGDTQLAIHVHSSGFSARATTWVQASCLDKFVSQLLALDELRQGSAQLESMSPGEFALRIFSVDRSGHLAVGGHVRRLVLGSFQHAIEFGFQFDPSCLPGARRGIEEIAERRSQVDQGTKTID